MGSGNSRPRFSSKDETLLAQMMSKVAPLSSIARGRGRVFSLTKNKQLVSHSMTLTPDYIAALHHGMQDNNAEYLINVVLDYLDDGRDTALTRTGLRIPSWVSFVQRSSRKANAALFGSPHCGKSRILQSYLRRLSARSSVTWDFTNSLAIDSITFDINIADNGGQEEFIAISDQLIRESEIIILVVCLQSEESLRYAHKFHERVVVNEYSEDFEAGAKCLVLASTNFGDDDEEEMDEPFWDVNDTQCRWKKGERAFNERDCMEIARQWNIPYIPTRPEEDLFIDVLFQESVREHVSRQRSQFYCLLPPSVRSEI